MDTDLLNHIIDGTNSDGFVYLNLSAKSVQELIAQGLIETNAADVNTSGQTAVRATKLGFSQVTPKEKGTKMSLVIENVPVVKPERKSIIRAPQYPELRDLEVGQSAMLEGIDVKKAQSLINSTERHFSTIKGQKTRKDGKVIDTRDYPRKFAFQVEAGGVRIGRVS